MPEVSRIEFTGSGFRVSSYSVPASHTDLNADMKKYMNE